VVRRAGVVGIPVFVVEEYWGGDGCCLLDLLVEPFGATSADDSGDYYDNDGEGNKADDGENASNGTCVCKEPIIFRWEK
jgi:hypothetical protein